MSVGTVDVGDEAKRHGALAVMLQGFIGHHRPQVGAADADVNNVSNPLARVPFPLAAPHPLGKIRHLIENGMDLRHYVLAIDDDGCSSRCAQRHVQHRPVFRDVDFFASKHGIDAFAQSGLVGELQKQLQRFIGDTVLRVIQIEPRSFVSHALAACEIIRKKLSEMQLAEILMVSLKGLPCLTLSERFDLR
jgi:hypothetical protein